MIVTADEVPKSEMFPGFFRQTLVWGEDLMLCLFTMQEGGVLPEHHHPHEQAGFVLSGSVALTVNAREFMTDSGCCYFIYSEQSHSAVVRRNAIVIDAFSPPRAEYVPAGVVSAKPIEFRANTLERRPNILESSTSPRFEPQAGLTRRQLLGGDKLVLSLLTMKKGTVVREIHSHETAGYLLSGRLDLNYNGGATLLSKESAFLLTRDTESSLIALGDSTLVTASAILLR